MCPALFITSAVSKERNERLENLRLKRQRQQILKEQIPNGKDEVRITGADGTFDCIYSKAGDKGVFLKYQAVHSRVRVLRDNGSGRESEGATANGECYTLMHGNSSPTATK